MIGNQKPTRNELSLSEFQRKFGNEEICLKRMFQLKWPDGYVCPCCKCREYSFIRTRHLYECKYCKNQTSATAGTAMHKTRVPLSKWFLAIYFITTDKRGISASLLSNILNVTYKTSWLMLHKIRYAMQERENQYKLQFLIELDETFLGAPSTGNEKRGRGTDKTQILIGVSVKDNTIQYAKLDVISDASSESIKKVVEKNILPKQKIKTDGWRGYSFLSETDHEHLIESISKAGLKAHDILKWVHIIASNLKSFIAGTFHGLEAKYLQSYLHEFTYRFNRRRIKNCWQNLLNACVRSNTITLTELKG